MDQFSNLFTTEGKFDSSTDSLGGEWDSEILRPHFDDLVDPTEPKNFGRVSIAKLSNEGREKVKALCANLEGKSS